MRIAVWRIAGVAGFGLGLLMGFRVRRDFTYPNVHQFVALVTVFRKAERLIDLELDQLQARLEELEGPTASVPE